MMEALKPCPVCNKDDKVVLRRVELGCQPCFVVVCCRCCYNYAAFITEESARRAWNRIPREVENNDKT